jgi:hypothetical protein
MLLRCGSVAPSEAARQHRGAMSMAQHPLLRVSRVLSLKFEYVDMYGMSLCLCPFVQTEPLLCQFALSVCYVFVSTGFIYSLFFHRFIVRIFFPIFPSMLVLTSSPPS